VRRGELLVGAQVPRLAAALGGGSQRNVLGVGHWGHRPLQQLDDVEVLPFVADGGGFNPRDVAGGGQDLDPVGRGSGCWGAGRRVPPAGSRHADSPRSPRSASPWATADLAGELADDHGERCRGSGCELPGRRSRQPAEQGQQQQSVLVAATVNGGVRGEHGVGAVVDAALASDGEQVPTAA